ncbi:hypothetical protein FOA52_012046 [Chlamydomonas sp. UWO 241]|nr:hypothetical protein FOA52_012046 [Chlamydomonas sp. UWO 241]
MATGARHLRNRGAAKSMKDASDSDDSTPDEANEGLEGGGPSARGGAGTKQPRARKAPAAPVAQGRPVGRPPRAVAGGRRKKDSGADLHGMSLLDILSKHAEAVPRAAKELVKEYQEDKSGATARLMTLVANTAGYDEEVTVDEAEDGEVDALVKNMAEHVIQHHYVDPLHEKKTRTFRPSYTAFFTALVSELHAAGLLLDDFFVERVSGLVISLSCSPAHPDPLRRHPDRLRRPPPPEAHPRPPQVQPFRLAGTLAASHLMAGWVQAQKLLARDLSQTQFQVDAEGKKRPPNKGLLDSLKKQLESQHRASSDLEATAKNVITSVFAVRFRDCVPEVRAVVIRAFADWIAAAPEAYLADAHLKYLGWALSDVNAEVRAAAVAGVSQLYGHKENVLGLHDFKVRFEARFKEMVFDLDEGVTVAALGLLAQLVEAEEMEQGAIRDDVYELLGDDSSAVRAAAADLVARLLLDAAQTQAGGSGSPADGAKSKRGKAGGNKAKDKAGTSGSGGAGTSSESAALRAQLECLLDLLATLKGGGVLMAQLECLLDLLATLKAARPVTSSQGAASGGSTGGIDVPELSRLLHERVKVLRSCGALTAALLDDELLEERGPGAASQIAELLRACVVRTAVEGDGTEGNDALQALSLEMVTQLPALLGKHQADAAVSTALMSVFLHLQLDVYVLSQEEAGFARLLGKVTEQLFRHAHDESAAASAAAALVHAADTAPAGLAHAAQLALSKAVTRAGDQLVAATSGVQGLTPRELKDQVLDLASDDRSSAGQLYALQCALVRSAALLRAGARALASQAPVYEALHYLLEDCLSSGRRLGSTVTQLALDSMKSVLAWQLVRASGEPGRAASGAALLAELRGRTQAFLTQLCALYPPGGGADQQDEADQDEEEGWEERAALLEEDDDAVRGISLRCLAESLTLFTGTTYEGEAWAAEAVPAEAPDDVVRCLWGYAAGALDAAQAEVEDADERLGDDDEEPEAPSAEHLALLSARAKAVDAQLGAVGVVGDVLSAARVLSHRHFRWLAAHLVSHMVSYGPEVAELTREVVRDLRSARPAVMPEVYMGAMKLAFNKVVEEEEQPEDEDGPSPALSDFSELCKCIAHMYVGHNIHREELMRIARAGLVYALSDAPSRLAFAAWGLGHFTGKLAQEDAASLVAEVEEASAGHDDDDEWTAMMQYLAGLRDRVSRGKGAARGALKGARAAAAAAPRPRKISFAADDGEGAEARADASPAAAAADGEEDDQRDQQEPVHTNSSSTRTLSHTQTGGDASPAAAAAPPGEEEEDQHDQQEPEPDAAPAWTQRGRRPARTSAAAASGGSLPRPAGGSLRHTYSGNASDSGGDGGVDGADMGADMMLHGGGDGSGGGAPSSLLASVGGARSGGRGARSSGRSSGSGGGSQGAVDAPAAAAAARAAAAQQQQQQRGARGARRAAPPLDAIPANEEEEEAPAAAPPARAAGGGGGAGGRARGGGAAAAAAAAASAADATAGAAAAGAGGGRTRRAGATQVQFQMEQLTLPLTHPLTVSSPEGSDDDRSGGSDGEGSGGSGVGQGGSGAGHGGAQVNSGGGGGGGSDGSEEGGDGGSDGEGPGGGQVSSGSAGGVGDGGGGGGGGGAESQGTQATTGGLEPPPRPKRRRRI